MRLLYGISKKSANELYFDIVKNLLATNYSFGFTDSRVRFVSELPIVTRMLIKKRVTLRVRLVNVTLNR